MGKFKKNRRTKSNGVNGSEQSKKSTLPVVKKLTAADADERSWAAATISQFALDETSLSHLMADSSSPGLFESLVALLDDESDKVVLEALGAIHNLLISAGDEVCRRLLAANVAKPLNSIFMRVASAFDNQNDPSKDSTVEMAEILMAVLCCLAEFSANVAQMLSQQTFIEFLMTLVLKSDIKSAGHLLMVLSEDNPDVHSIFAQNSSSLIQPLMDLVSGSISNESLASESSRLESAVVSANILYNMRSLIVTDDSHAMEFYGPILKAASVAVDNPILAQLSAALASRPTQMASTDSQSEVTDVLRELNQAQHETSPSEILFDQKADTMLHAIEVLTNIYSEETIEKQPDDEYEEVDQHMEQDDDAEVMDDMQVMETDDTNTMQHSDAIRTILSTALFDAQTNIFPNLLKLSFLEKNLPPGIQKSEQKDKIRSIVVRSVQCLNNMALLGFAKEWIEANHGSVHELWDTLFVSCTGHSLVSTDKTDMDIFDAVINLLWSLLTQCMSVSRPIPAKQTCIDWLINMLGVESNLPSETRSRIAAILSLFGRYQGCVSFNKAIGTKFMALLQSSAESNDVLCEVLDGIYDIYSDSSFDYDEPVFVNGQFLPIIQNMYPVLRSRFKGIDKRTHREMRERADEMILNLRAFIQYKLAETTNR